MADEVVKQEEVQPIELTISGVLEDLKNGVTRKEIGEKYGLNYANLNALFQHDKLKGARVHPKLVKQFILKDDMPDYVPKKPKPRTVKAKVAADSTNGGTAENAPTSSDTSSVAQQVAAEGVQKGTW